MGKLFDRLQNWSDRCGYERASVIIKCIRNEKPYLLE